MNPDEHLTDEQRELLVSADYYDKLNAATAYFPENNKAKVFAQQNGQVDMEEDRGQEMSDVADQQNNAQQQMIHEEDQDYDDEEQMDEN